MCIFNEAEIYEDAEKAEEKLTVVAGHTHRKKKEYTLDKLPEGIPVEIVEHRIPESKLACPQCGETMTPIGKEVTRKLKIIPARTVIVEDHYYSYACRNCEKENIQIPVWERLHTELIGREVLYADETTLQVLHEEGKKAQSKSYLWLYRTSGDTDKPIVLCEYQPSRKRIFGKVY